MIPSPSDLKYFMEVASRANISRAAERLGISQPSLTLAIQRLETSVGTKILIRSKKGVTLTQAGKQLFAHARSLLQDWEMVKSRALASTHLVEGIFSLGCHPSVALYSLPQFLPDLLESFPKLEVRLVHNLSRKIVESVVSMEIDVGIAVNPVKHPDLIIRKLTDDKVTFWVGEGNRKIQDFQSGQAILICDPELLQSQTLLKQIRSYGFSYQRTLFSSSLEVITYLTLGGAGIGIIPERVVSVFSQNKIGLLRRVSKTPVFNDEICLLYRSENRNVRAIQAMAQAIIQGFKS